MPADIIDVEARPVLEELLSPTEINLIRVLNPFDPRDHVREIIPFKPALSLADAFPLGSAAQVISVNGKVIDCHDWGITYVERGDTVVVCPVPHGGGAKKVLAVVAMLAVSVFAPMASAAMAGSMGLGAMGSAMLTVGLTLAGSMLVHSIFAPSKPTAENRQLSTVSNETSPTYGIDGAKNTSVEAIPVPVCYGSFRMAGNIVSLHTDNVGETQDLYVLLNAGEGPVQGISDIRLNDVPYTEFPNVTVELRLGQNSQGTIPWFNTTVVPHNIGTKLAADGSWTPYTTATDVDRLRVDLVAPNGMCTTNKQTGESSEFSVPIEVEYALNGTGAWHRMSRADGGASEFRAKVRNQVRLSWDSGQLPVNGSYNVRVRRGTFEAKDEYISDKVFVSDINEILMDPMTYPNTALVGLKIRLGEQLSAMPQISFLNHGKVINTWNGASWVLTNSSNPAWIVWDMLTNSLYGAGMATSRLDLASFKRWADHCDAEGLLWNGPLDTETNVWDATQYVLRVGRAQLINIGTRWSVVVEKAQTPSMMFTVANMVQGSYQESWLPMNDRANEIDVTYFDKDDDYKRRTIKVYDPMSLAAGQPQKTASITLYGVVNYDRAFKEAMFMLNLNRFILKTVSFRAPMEALACTVGDLIYVQHDMPHWADSGRTGAGSSASTIVLDRPVTIESGKNYTLLVKHDRILRAAGAVTAVAGNIVSVSGYSGVAKISRFRTGAIDRAVVGGGPGWLELDGLAGIGVGSAYEGYETEVIEERSVLATVGERTSLELASAFSQAPDQFVTWMFGETVKVKKVFRIKALSGGGADGTREITAIQYDPNIYDYGRFGTQFSGTTTIDLSKAPLGQVRFPELYEETFIAGNAVETKVTVAWQTPQTGRYAGADVYFALQGSPYTAYEVKGRTSVSFPAARGQTVWAKIVAFDLFGNRVAYAGAPELNYTVMGELTGIDVGAVSAPDVVWNGRDCRLTWRYNSLTHSYDFGSEPVTAGADAGAMDPQFKDYEIRVWHQDDAAGAAPRRVEYTSENGYTYSYEKNFNDGLARRLRFEVRMRDIFNNLGAPAVLTAANLAPRLVSVRADTNFEAAQIFIEHSSDTDFAGTVVWVATAPEPIAGDIYNNTQMAPYVKYNGVDQIAYVTGLMPNTQYYLRAVAYDVFGFTELLPSAVIPFKTTFMNIDAIQKGILDESVLVPALQDRINLIDGPADLPGTVANLIKHEEQQRQAGDNDLMAQVTDVVGSKINDVQAAIASEAQTRATRDSAFASSLDTVATTVNQNTAVVQVVATSVDGLKAQYTVKIDNNGYVSGFGLASTAVNGVPTSEFVVRADKFAVIMPGQGAATPFVIGAVNGVPAVTIKKALIGDATINQAMIVDGNITNAKIGFQIASDNHVWHEQGWSIWKDGVMDVNGNAYFDRVFIRRRPVIQSGVHDPDISVDGTWLASATNSDGAIYYTRVFHVANSAIHVEVLVPVLTDLFDSDTLSLVNNQPYHVACGTVLPHTIRNFVGNGTSVCDFACAVYGEVVPAAYFANSGTVYQSGRLMVKFHAVVHLIAGSFTSFRFPPIQWAVYKI